MTETTYLATYHRLEATDYCMGHCMGSWGGDYDTRVGTLEEIMQWATMYLLIEAKQRRDNPTCFTKGEFTLAEYREDAQEQLEILLNQARAKVAEKMESAAREAAELKRKKDEELEAHQRAVRLDTYQKLKAEFEGGQP